MLELHLVKIETKVKNDLNVAIQSTNQNKKHPETLEQSFEEEISSTV